MAYFGQSVESLEKRCADLRSRRDKAIQAARQISEDAAAGKRPDNRETETAYQRANSEFDSLARELREAQTDLATARAASETAREFDSAFTRATGGKGLMSDMTYVPQAEARYGKPFGPGQGFSDLGDSAERGKRTPEEAGEYIRAILLGDFEKRATMVENVNGMGGYFVPEVLSSPLLDLARAETRVAQLGASVIPLESDTNHVPRHDVDPVLAFRNEAALIAETNTTIGDVVLTPRSAAALIRVSEELLEDSQFPFDAYIAGVVAAAAAAAMDQKALYGSGTAPEVRGVKNTAGVVVTNLGANGAALSNHDAIVDLVARVNGKGYTTTGLLTSPRLYGSMAKFREGAGTGQYLAPPKYISDLPFLTSTNVPTTLTVGTSGAVCTDVFAGDWSKVLIGVRHALSIRVLNERFADTGEIGFVASLRFDVQVSRPAALEILSGVTN